jgi:pyridoxal phosphate enzyme (YggS family)
MALPTLSDCPLPLPDLAARLQHIRDRVQLASRLSGRPANAVRLLAVTKTFPPAAIEQAVQQGQRCFGENYVQEGVAKIIALSVQPTLPPLEWHFIGPIQSNKTRAIAEHFDWVQSLDRLSIAQRLSDQRPSQLPALQVLIQVNISAEDSKSGVSPDAALTLAMAVAQLPRLHLRGIMAIPRPDMTPDEQRDCFERLHRLWETCRLSFPDVDTLSVGMSDDFELAIAAGSTMVRIGSAIFGERT